MHRAIFLDRDDTLIANRTLTDQPGCAPGDLCDPARVQLLPGVLDACARLARAEYLLIVVTNQGVVARGGGTIAQVEATHDRLCTLLTADADPLLHAVYYCPYHPAGSVQKYRREHPWRKPSPGMILAAAADHDIELASSWLIGDARRDAQAAIAAGIPADRCLLLAPHGRVEDLSSAAAHILAQSV